MRDDAVLRRALPLGRGLSSNCKYSTKSYKAYVVLLQRYIILTLALFNRPTFPTFIQFRHGHSRIHIYKIDTINIQIHLRWDFSGTAEQFGIDAIQDDFQQ